MSIPSAKVAVFVGTEADVINGKTPWGEIAAQLGCYHLIKDHDQKRIAPGKELLHPNYKALESETNTFADELLNPKLFRIYKNAVFLVIIDESSYIALETQLKRYLALEAILVRPEIAQTSTQPHPSTEITIEVQAESPEGYERLIATRSINPLLVFALLDNAGLT